MWRLGNVGFIDGYGVGSGFVAAVRVWRLPYSATGLSVRKTESPQTEKPQTETATTNPEPKPVCLINENKVGP